LLKQQDSSAEADPRAVEVAVIAAGMFAVLGSSAAVPGERADTDSAPRDLKPSSNWKSAAYREGLQ